MVVLSPPSDQSVDLFLGPYRLVGSGLMKDVFNESHRCW